MHIVHKVHKSLKLILKKNYMSPERDKSKTAQTISMKTLKNYINYKYNAH